MNKPCFYSKIFPIIILFLSGFSGSVVAAVDSQNMMQYKAAGHILGFQKDCFLMASEDHMLRIDFIGATGHAPVSATKATETETGLQPLKQMTYDNLWDGITLAYEQGSGGVKSTYRLSPGADVSSIRLRYNAPLEVTTSGALYMGYETGYISESAPVAWQEINGKKSSVAVSFRKIDAQEAGFSVCNYDTNYPLIIDPLIQWNTFMGSPSGHDYGNAVTVDASGNVYVTGESTSSWGSPVNPHAGGLDAFAAKYDSSGNLIWNTFMGSAIETDRGLDIAVDDLGNVYVTGRSHHTWGNPIDPHDTSPSDFQNAFIAKIDSSGNLIWNTFMPHFFEGSSIAIDASHNVYVAGSRFAVYVTDWTAVISKHDADGNKIWEKYIGGAGKNNSRAIDLDSSGNIYVAGSSSESWGNPINPFIGSSNFFLVKLDTSGNLLWNTFYGGASGTHLVNDMNVDNDGNAYIGGESYNSTWGNPMVPYLGNRDAFAAKFDTNGDLIWNTFAGGATSQTKYGKSINVDASGNVYLAGYSNRDWGIPLTPHATGTEYDAFVLKLDNDGNYLWNTFMGTPVNDYGIGISVDVGGNSHVVGYSFESWGTPVNPHTGIGNNDGFLAKFDTNGSPIWHTFIGQCGNGGLDKGRGIAIDASNNVYVTGYSDDNWGKPVIAHSGYYSDAFAAKFDSSGNRLWHTFMGAANEIDEAYDIDTDASGNVYVIGASYVSWGAPLNAHTPGSNCDAFLVKLDSNGNLLWNTFWGSSIDDRGRAIVVNDNGDIFIAGYGGNWGTPVNIHAGGTDAFAAKIDTNGSPVWHTYMGSGSTELGYGIAIDINGNVYVTGRSGSLTWGSPVDAHAGGSYEAFAVKLDASGNRIWNTFMGASSNDYGREIIADGIGNVYVVGYGNATWGSPLQPHAGGYDAFAVKIDASGNRIWNTFIGSAKTDDGYGIGVDSSGNVYIAGQSDGSWGVPENLYTGLNDAFAAKLDANGNRLWNTFIGSSEDDRAYAMVLDTAANLYLSGNTGGDWGNPVNNYGGNTDAFAVKLTPGGSCTFSIDPTSNSVAGQGETGSVTVDALVGICTWTAFSNNPWITVTAGESGPGDGAVEYAVAANQSCTPRSGTLTIAGEIFTIDQAAGVCAYNLSPVSRTIDAQSAIGSVGINTMPCCSWTATSNDAWITVTAGSAGTGNGTVSYSVTENTNALPRNGSISVSGATHRVFQSGTGGVPVWSGSFTGGSDLNLLTGNYGDNSLIEFINDRYELYTENLGLISDKYINSFVPGCTEDAIIQARVQQINQGDDFIASLILRGDPEAGTGYFASIDSFGNLTLSMRMPGGGMVTLASMSVLGQVNPGDCQLRFAAIGDGLFVKAWSTGSPEPDGWMLEATNSDFAFGNGGLSLGSESSSQGYFSPSAVAFDDVSLTTDLSSFCETSISAQPDAFDGSGGSGSVNVVTSYSFCTWEATSNDAWIIISSGQSYTGNKSVAYDVAVNTTSSPRTGILTIAGITFTVNQAASACIMSVAEPSLPGFSVSGGSGTVGVSASLVDCDWQATSEAPSWLHVTSGTDYAGSDIAAFTVDVNSTGSGRTGDLTIAGETVTIWQSGLAGDFKLSITSNTSDGSIDFLDESASWHPVTPLAMFIMPLPGTIQRSTLTVPEIT